MDYLTRITQFGYPASDIYPLGRDRERYRARREAGDGAGTAGKGGECAEFGSVEEYKFIHRAETLYSTQYNKTIANLSSTTL